MATHDIGDTVRLWVVFRDEAGSQAAPTAVSLIVRSPDGTDTAVTPTAASAGDVSLAEVATGETLTDQTGVWKAVVSIDQAGVWIYEWTGAGTVDESAVGDFAVRPRRVGDPS